MSALWCRFWLLASTVALWIVALDAKEFRIVCYYTNWSVYRPGDAKFNPQNINPYLCTHLIYAFGGFTKENTLKPFDKYQDIEKGGYAKFVGLKTYNKNLKTLLAIGGWNEGSSRFSPMVANPDRRKELVKNTIKFLRQNHFDGLDLDWEYPSFRDGGKSRDRDNYAQLVQELREEFDRESEKTGRPRLLLTMAVPAGIEYINKGYDIPKLTQYLDWMNILSYDYHSAYEPAVNHHSPLYPIEEENEYSLDIDLNIDYTIKHYMKKGADRTKLVVGIPTYGRSYTLYNPDANEIGSPADGPGEMGDATRENGYLAYYEICEKLKSDDWIIEAPYPDDMGPYAYKDNQWVGYDDEDIARKKAEYVAKNGLGGIMFWSIDNDDFRGKCGDRPYPIIEAAKEALLKAYGLSDASLLATTKKPVKTRTKTRGTTRTVESTTESLSTVRLRQNSRRKNVNRVNGEETKPASKRRPSSRRNKKKQETTTSISSLVITPSYTTPAPPSTPDSGGDFKCEDEGFFPHPKDCKKYFWCLSGPSELGIVAHQFTCPAGLYFNKAAASCDYSQNVLCNKKLTKATTTTTTTSPTSSTIASTSLSTRRPPAKITAATSRTTVTTTEPPAEEEDEDYDEEYEDEEGTAGENAEQDPRVIKELIQLIRKAGGIEELEKQLKISEGGNIGVDSTTRSTINKSLYEKVLSRATATLKEQKRPAFKTYNTIGRNSRGPQNEGLEQPNETPSRGRPQYTSIVRSRPSTEASDIKPVYEEDEEDVEQPSRSRPFYKKNQPEYVTIRRQRITTTTETSAAENSRPQFKQLGESETPDEDEQSKHRSSTTSSPYVTIKRFRPTTETIESDNTEIAHTESSEDSSTPPPEYVAVKRQRPNATQENSTTTRYLEVRGRGTTTTSSDETSSTTQESKEEKPYRTIDESANSVEENTVENTDTNATEQTVNNNNNNNNSNNDTLKDVVDNIKEIINSQKQEEEHETLPVLSDPRPFSLTPRTRPSTTTEEIPKDVKVSVSSPRNVLRNKILEARIPPSSKNVNNQEINTDDEKNNDVLDDEDRQNRFSTRHRFSTETAKEDNQIVRIRGRGHSRFTAHTVATTTIRTRPITRITEKPYTDYEAIEYNRKYRPDIVAEISDLSSLLAVDLKDLQAGRKFGRRRRPVTQTTSTSTTTLPTSTTTELDESLKTGSRTLPVARKLLDGSKFGRANRFRSTTTTTTTTTENQPKQEDEVSERPVKIFIRPFSKNPNLLDGSRLNRFRKASINTTEEATTSTARPLPIRRRIVLRKLKKPTSTTTTTESSTTTTEKQSPPETTTESLKTTTVNLKTTTTENLKTTTIENPKTTTENLKTTTENLTTTTENLKTATENLNVTAETLKPTENETENEKTTTEKENTTFLNDVIESTRTSNDETDDDKSEEADDNEEGENIKLSESIVRENSQNFGNIIQEGLKLGKLADKSYKSIGKDLIFDERPSTEPSFSVRTRKIIKKLSTTESPVFTAEGEAPKFKKVVRKLKLTTASGNSLGEDEKPIEVSTASLLNKGRRKFGETEAEYDEEREGRRYGFKRPSYLTTAKIKEKEDDEEEQELGGVKGLEAKKAVEEETSNPIKPPFKLNRPLFRRRKINTSNAGDNRPENNDKRPLFTRRKFGSSTFKPIQEDNKEINLNKALYNRRIPTFTVYSTTSTPSPSSTTETTIQYETEEDNTISTITTEAETELNEEITTETASIDKTEIVYTIAVPEETTLEDLTTTNRNEETTDQTTLKAANIESSTIKYGSTRYGEVSNTTSLPPSTRKGKLYFKNKQYGTNSVLENTDKNTAVRKFASTTESALSKLLKRRKEHKKVVAIEEDIKVREENTRVREEEIKILEEETDIGRKRTKVLEEETKVREEEIKVHEEETKLRKKEEDGEEEGITVVNTNKPENDFFTDVITTQVQTTTNENEGEVKTTMLQDIQDKTEYTTENIPTTVEDLSTLTEDLSPTTTESKNDEIITTTEYVTTTTTTRKPSRLFRPIGLRPKFTGRIKSSEPSTTSTPIISTSERFKTNRFNKFKVKPTPKRFIPTSTIENEDLAYGPIKEFKPAFRPSLYRQRNKFVSEKEEDKQEEEEEEEDADSDDYVEEDVTEVDEKQHPRPNLFSKPGYIILKPSPNAHDEVVNEENDEDENDKEEKSFSSSNPSNIYFSSTSKPSTRLYKKFTTPSPVTVAQNLSDVNITAVNQRNKNLFNKTRKMNTPFAGVTAKIDANKTADTSYQLSLLTSTKQDDVTEKVSPTTDRATTLLHIFSENENPNETTLSYSPNDEPPEKKIEKIVEINRIVKVTAKVNNGTNVIETEGTDKPEKVDRLLVSRVTEIKVVEGRNGTNRQEKKYEGGRRTDNDFNIPLVTSSDVAQINQIHIDSASSIVKKITPKPFYTVESATIPLEGLFQANTPKVDLQNELLEGENSNYVNVRVLQQESPNKLSRMATNAKFIPVRILKDEDEIIMKADVVEVTPSASKQQIKIVPISVSIQTT